MNLLFPSLRLGGSAQRRGFTMIEILVVVVIIGVLAFALIPRFAGYQARARDTARDVSLKQTASALELYANDNYGQYPDPYRGLGMNNSFVASLNRENFYASLDNPRLLSVYDIRDHLNNYLQVLPTDPGHGLMTNIDNGSCVQGGDYFAYVVNNTRHMFGIISHAESRKGNAQNCEGRAFNTRDGRFFIVGVNLLGEGEAFVPGPGGPGQGGNSGNGGGDNNYGGGVGGGGGSQNVCFDIEINDDTTSAKIINYNNSLSGCGSTVTIPASLSGLSVTHIGSSAFTNKSINQVTIPSSVVSIGTGAFESNGPGHSYDLTGFVIGETQTWRVIDRIWVREGNNGDEEEGSLEACFTFNNGTITRYNYLDDPETYDYCGTDVDVPETIGGVTVTAIGERAFSLFEDSISQIHVFNMDKILLEEARPEDFLDNPDNDNNEYIPGFSDLTSIKLPNTLQRIEAYAFAMSPSMSNITIPSHVTEIGEGAFAITNKTELDLPSGITSIAPGVFAINNFTSITIPSTVQHIGRAAFFGNILDGNMANATLRSLDLGQGVQSIEPMAFAANPNLNTISFGSVQTIERLAFMMSISQPILRIPGTIDTINFAAFAMIGASAVYIEDGVQSIEFAAFAGSKITQARIPNSVTTIQDLAFNVQAVETDEEYENEEDENRPLTGRTPGNGGEWAVVNREWVKDGVQGNECFTINNGIITDYDDLCGTEIHSIPSVINWEPTTSIAAGAFEQKGLTYVAIPHSITSIAAGAFANNGPNATSSDIGGHQPGQEGYRYISQGEWVKETDHGCFRKNNEGELGKNDDCFTTNLVIPMYFEGSSVTSLGWMGHSVESLIIPDTVLNISNRAFGYKGLQSVRLGNNIQTIGEGAFQGNNISTVEIPDSVTHIGSSAFSNSNISSLTLGNSLQTIEMNAFYYNNISTVEIPDSVTHIGSSAFTYNNISSLTLGNSLQTIGGSSFYDNNISSLTIPNSVNSIGDSAFAYNNISSLTLRNSLQNIGNQSFYNNNISSLTIPNSVTSIGTYAFGHNNISSLTLGNSLQSIGYCAFTDNNISSLTIPNSLTYIEECAFSRNNISSLTIPSSITHIGPGAFRANGPNKTSGNLTRDGTPSTWAVSPNSWEEWIKQ